MALADSAALLAMNFNNVVSQVQVAALAYAGTVNAEVNTTPNHANRLDLAQRVMKDSSQKYTHLLVGYLVAENTSSLTLDSSGTSLTLSDSVVLGAVQGVWNDMANAVANPNV